MSTPTTGKGETTLGHHPHSSLPTLRNEEISTANERLQLPHLCRGEQQTISSHLFSDGATNEQRCRLPRPYRETKTKTKTKSKNPPTATLQ